MTNTKKLFKTARERTISGALGIALLFSSVNLKTKAENLVPSPTAFGEPSAFGSSTGYGLDTDDKVQKVYFGKNGDVAQGWYIAGYDEVTGGLVFLCDPNQPIASNQVFCNETSIRAYNKSWGCTYSNTPEKVNPNHYGGSDIRKKLQELEKDTKVFTEAEQCLMKETKIYTYDSKQNNYRTYYSTKDKLYLAAAGGYQDSYITVGANTVDSAGTANARINNGLKVKLNSGPNGSPYTTGEAWFWLRSPYIDYNVAHGASIGDHVTIYNVDDNYNCVPAFALDTSSMLFASAAVPVSSNSTLSDGIYFRFKDTNSKIDTTLAANGNELTITRGTNNAYLYIQGKDNAGDWVYSKLISNTETLAAKDIHTGLTNFSNCKAWLETSEDNITYAQELNLDNVNTIKLINVYTVNIRLKDETGKMITNTEGIALKLGKTSMNDNEDGIFTLNNLTDESYKLTIIVDENVSNYLAPGVSTFTITRGGNGSVETATLNAVVKLQQKEIEVGRVLTGIGGEAGYKYNRKTGKTKFYCSPYPGYKLDRILKDADGKTEYVSFKIV